MISSAGHSTRDPFDFRPDADPFPPPWQPQHLDQPQPEFDRWSAVLFFLTGFATAVGLLASREAVATGLHWLADAIQATL